MLCMLFFDTDQARFHLYFLSLHDSLPILLANDTPSGMRSKSDRFCSFCVSCLMVFGLEQPYFHLLCHSPTKDRKSTRLNSSHVSISYAVFCFKKKLHVMNGIFGL